MKDFNYVAARVERPLSSEVRLRERLLLTALPNRCPCWLVDSLHVLNAYGATNVDAPMLRK